MSLWKTDAHIYFNYTFRVPLLPLIPYLLWNPEDHYRVYKIPLLDYILSQFN
jgi:hypothetical protein